MKMLVVSYLKVAMKTHYVFAMKFHKQFVYLWYLG